MRPFRLPFPSRPLPILVACALLVLAVQSLFNGCAKAKPPPPPLPVEEVSIPDSLKREPVVALSDSTFWTVEVRDAKNILVRRNVTWYLVNRRNPPLLERINFYENDILQAPLKVKMEAWYPDRDLWRITEKDMQRQALKPEGLYVEPSGSLLVAKVPRYGGGLVLRVESVDTYVRPEFRSQDILRGDHPCLKRFVAFRAPEGHTFRIGLRNREGLAVRSDTLRAGGAVEYRWSAGDLPKLIAERSPRYAEEWHAGLHFSIPPRGLESWTWKRLGDHYLEMMKGSLQPAPALKAAAAGLGEGNAEVLSERAFRLVKSHVRYLGDFRGINAWVPRTPQSVWDNGYGDCKEMANVLRALLAEKGVEGGLALVRTAGGNQLLEDFPALNPFNHAVFWRRRADGSLAVLDPTLPGDLGSGSYLPLLGQKVFLVQAGASAVDTVEPAPGYRNRVTTASALARGGDGAWELRGTLTLKGKVAQDLWLPLHFEPNRDEARARVGTFLARRFGIQAREFAWRAPAADSLEIDYALPADGMAAALEDKAVKLDLPWICAAARPDEEGEGGWRGFPLEQNDAWTLPPGFTRLRSQDLPGPRAVGIWSLAGGLARRAYILSDPSFGPEETEARRTFRETFSRFSAATVWK